MASVFDMPKISYALEKLGEFIHGSGSGADVPGWSNAASKVVLDNLQAFKEKLRAHNVSPDECEEHVGAAIYAVCELQSFVTGDKSDILDRNAAKVYRGFLAAKIEELRRLEQELDPPRRPRKRN